VSVIRDVCCDRGLAWVGECNLQLALVEIVTDNLEVVMS